MGWKKTLLVILAVEMAVVSYYVYNPMPSSVEEPWKYNLYLTICRLVADYSRIGSKLTGQDGRIFLRNVIGYLEKYSSNADPDVNVTDDYFSGVKVRIYQPPSTVHSGGGLLYYHGGGFIAGSPRGYDQILGDAVLKLNITIVAVDYRKTPENPSPVPFDDGLIAAKHFFKYSSNYGVRRNNIGIAGDSAGGCIAASLTSYLKDQGGSDQVAYQVLIYPLLQGLDLNLPSYQAHDKQTSEFTHRWAVAGVVATFITGMDDYHAYVPHILHNGHVTKAVLEDYRKYVDWKMLPPNLIHEGYQPYTGSNPNKEIIKKLQEGLLNPYNFPLMSKSVEGLPPTYILTTETDTLRDDGFLYARRLRESNVTVTHYNSLGGWHGMLTFYRKVNAASVVFHDFTNFIGKYSSLP